MFLKNALAYSGTNLISQIALFIQGFILRRILPPEVMGVWNYVGVVKGFAASFSIGLLSGAVRELPILKGRGDEKGQDDVRAVSFSYSLIEIVFVCICIVIYALVRKNSISLDEYASLILTAILLLFVRFQESYTTFFQGAQLYVPLSRLLLINSLILAVALLVGAAIMGLWGIFIAVLVAEGIKAVWIRYAGRYFGIRPLIKWDLQIFKRLASYSISYRVSDYPIVLFMMLDILWVTKFMNMESLAIYVMARSFFLQVSEITVRFGTVFMTRTFEQYGQVESKEKIANDLYRFIQIQLLVTIPLVCWMIFSVAPLLIRQITPLYVDCIYPMTILIPVSFFDMRNNNLFTIWLAEKKLLSYWKANVFSLTSMVIVISIFWFIMENRTLASISFSVVIGYFVNFMYLMITIGRKLFGNKRMILLFGKVAIAAFWVAFVLIYFAQKEPLSMSLREDTIFSMKKMASVFLLIVPIVVFGIKVSRVVSFLQEKYKR